MCQIQNNHMIPIIKNKLPKYKLNILIQMFVNILKKKDEFIFKRCCSQDDY